MKTINLFVLIFVTLNLIYLSNAQSSPKCDTCLAEGEKCMTSIIGNTGSLIYSDERLCAAGYTCGPLHFRDTEKDYVCIKLIQENGKCLYSKNNCDVGLTCKNSFCVSSSYSAIGDKCKLDSDCNSVNSLCANFTCLIFNNMCSNYLDCSADFFCSSSSQCIPRLTLNEVCLNDDQCVYGLSCSTIGNSVKTCKYPQPKLLGETCSVSTECDQMNAGLYCSPFSKKCEKYFKSTITNCTPSGQADVRSCDEYNTCNLCDGKCYQSALLPSQLFEYQKPLLDCMEKNKCSILTLRANFGVNFESQESCLSKHCGAEYCKSLKGISTDNNPHACQRKYHVDTYCGRITSPSYSPSPSNSPIPSNPSDSSDSSDSDNPSNLSKLSISIISLIVLVFVVLLI